MAERDIDVLSFGEALVDFFPSETGVPLAEVDVFHRHLGGAPANVAVGLARLGVRSALMTLVGADEFGRFVKDALAREGVDVAGIGIHRTAKTGVTFVSVTHAGERSFLFYRHPSADQQITEADVDAAQIARARVFHFGSSTLSREPSRAATLKALGLARSGGALISVDPNWRPHLWEKPEEAAPLVRQALASAALVKVSDDELGPLVGENDAEKGARALRALGAKLALVTLGARGCYFDAPCGRGYVAGQRVKAVDTTGAGDGFVAGMWAALLPNLPAGASVDAIDEATLRAACTMANRVGAKTVTRLGATAALPRKEELSDA